MKLISRDEGVYQFDDDRITGILSRNFPLFNQSTRDIFASFFTHLLNENNQGVSLLRARQESITSKTARDMEQKMTDGPPKEVTRRIDLRSSLAVASFLLFGRPWKKIRS